MRSCEAYQEILEMERWEAADPAEAAEARAHLEGCTPCQKAEALAGSLRAHLERAPGPGPSRLDVLIEKAAKEERRSRWLPLGLFVSFVVQGAFFSWLISPEMMLRTWSIFFAMGVAFGVGTALWLKMARTRTEAALAQGTDAWIAQRKRRLRSELRQTTSLRFLIPLLVAIIAVAAPRSMPDGNNLKPFLWIAVGMLIAGTLILEAFLRPSLQRALSDLEGMAP